MNPTVDHLRAGQRATVLREFVDARGVFHAVGESGRLERVDLDWTRNEIAISWLRGARAETMYFPIAPGAGPGNGRMREYFAVEEPALPPRRVRASAVGQRPPPPPELPEPGPEIIHDPARYDDAMARVVALAARLRIDDAEAQLRAMDDVPTVRIADDLVDAAEQYAGGHDDVVSWFCRRARDYWYAWGSEATGGGEGAERLLSIEPAMERLRTVERLRDAT